MYPVPAIIVTRYQVPGILRECCTSTRYIFLRVVCIRYATNDYIYIYICCRKQPRFLGVLYTSYKSIYWHLWTPANTSIFSFRPAIFHVRYNPSRPPQILRCIRVHAHKVFLCAVCAALFLCFVVAHAYYIPGTCQASRVIPLLHTFI